MTEYAFRDSDPNGLKATITHCFGDPLGSEDQARRIGDKNVFGKTVVLKREAPDDEWEVIPENYRGYEPDFTTMNMKGMGEVSFDLFYPGIEGNPDSVKITLMAVRAANDIHIKFDFENNGWVILSDLEDSDDPTDLDSIEGDLPLHQVAFIPAWPLTKRDGEFNLEYARMFPYGDIDDVTTEDDLEYVKDRIARDDTYGSFLVAREVTKWKRVYEVEERTDDPSAVDG